MYLSFRPSRFLSRFFKAVIVDQNPSILSAGLISAYHLCNIMLTLIPLGPFLVRFLSWFIKAAVVDRNPSISSAGLVLAPCLSTPSIMLTLLPFSRTISFTIRPGCRCRSKSVHIICRPRLGALSRHTIHHANSPSFSFHDFVLQFTECDQALGSSSSSHTRYWDMQSPDHLSPVIYFSPELIC
jgi:hypothetical protein